jgi:hypothetical protein
VSGAAAAVASLPDQVDSALERATRLLPLHGPLAYLRAELRELRARQARPLRVVVTGRAKSGKSTLISALGGDLPFEIVEASWEDLADAIPEAFVVAVNARGESRDDVDMVRGFQQLLLTSEIATPLNALAVLGIERYWNAYQPAPQVEAERVIAQLMSDAGGRRLLSQVRPVATRVAAAARTFEPADVADLRRLATEIDPEILEEMAENEQYFSSPDEEGLPVPAERRAALIARFSGYGIMLACSRLRDGGDPVGADGLREWLLDRSGAPGLREQMLRQFGRHAQLIKLHGLIRRVRQVAAELTGGSRGPLTGWDESTIHTVIGLLREDSFDDSAWTRFTAVQSLHAGKARSLGRDADIEEAFQLLGERGDALADRLGLPPDTPPAALAAEAAKRHRKWAGRQSHPYTGETRQVYSAVLRACDAVVIEAEAGG